MSGIVEDINIEEALNLLRNKQWRRQFNKIKRISWGVNPTKVLTLEGENIEEELFLQQVSTISNNMKGFTIEIQLYKRPIFLNI